MVVKLDRVYLSLSGRPVLENINLTVKQGSFLGIIGPNGAGKTTLLRLILGLVAPDRGSVLVFNKPPHRLTGRHRSIGYLPQRPNFDRRFPISVKDVVLMGATGKSGLLRPIDGATREFAGELMRRMGIADLQNRPVGELSGGQQQLTFLAAALVTRPKLLLLDEPTTGLDPTAQDQFYKLVKELQEEMELTVLAVSHDLAAISANADELVCINKTMHLHGQPIEVIEKLSGNQNYRCEFDVFFGNNFGRYR